MRLDPSPLLEGTLTFMEEAGDWRPSTTWSEQWPAFPRERDNRVIGSAPPRNYLSRCWCLGGQVMR